jgi:putative endonuclease
MSNSTRHFGRQGEEAAVEFLQQSGYRILEKNFRNKIGEVDVIAIDKDTVCFIEVKSRRTSRSGSPWEAISPFKQRKIIQVALSYLKWKQWLSQKARFDVVGIWEEENSIPRIEILKNAFDASDFS